MKSSSSYLDNSGMCETSEGKQEKQTFQVNGQLENDAAVFTDWTLSISNESPVQIIQEHLVVMCGGHSWTTSDFFVQQ